MDAQQAEVHDATDDAVPVQPVSEGEHRFFHAVGKGAAAGVFLGAILGLVVAFVVKASVSDVGGAQIAGIVVGSLAGGVFLGISIACGMNAHELGEH